MFVLDGNLRSVELALGAAKTTADMPWVASWCDFGADFAGAAETTLAGTTNGTTPVAVVPAPPSDLTRKLRKLTVLNADSAAKAVLVRFNDNGTITVPFNVTLAAGSQLVYEDGCPLAVYDKNGALQ